MRLFERIEAALAAADANDYVIALEWQGVQLQFATVSEPQNMPAPQILVIQRPKSLEEQELIISNPELGGPPFRITREQVQALRRKYDQHPDGASSFDDFKNRVRPAGTASDQYLALRWCGMWLGVEPDGYTHS